MLIKTFENVIGGDFAEMYYHILAYQPGWRWGHRSEESTDSLFWYKQLTTEGDPLTKHLTRKVESIVADCLNLEATVLNVYANGQTSNLITAPHHDDLDKDRWTCLYYPRTLSDKEGGETFFYHADGRIRLVNPSVADTAVLFDSRIKHVGRPPTNSSRDLRITVAYKLAVTMQGTAAV